MGKLDVVLHHVAQSLMTLSEFAQRFVFVNEALIRGGLAV